MNDKKGQFLVSVILVTYGQLEYLYETIDSILMQDYSFLEVIVADDSSEYFDEEEIKKYFAMNQKENIQKVEVYTNQKNLGTVKNINNAIRRSTGDGIMIIGGDDAYSYDCVVSDFVREICTNQREIVVGKIQQCDEFLKPVHDERIEKGNQLLEKILIMDGQEAIKLIRKENIFPIATQAMMYTSAFFTENGLYDERYKLIEDAPMVYKILSNKCNVGYLDKKVTLHRRSVGVSANDAFFRNNKRVYYNDLMIFYKSLLINNKTIIPKRLLKIDYRRACFAYEMSILVHEQEKTASKLRTILKYLDVPFFNFIERPKQFISKARRVLGEL